MLFGYCPFESNSIAKLISALQENELRLPIESIPISTQTQNLLKRVLTKDHFKRIDWPGLFQLMDEQQPEQQVNSLIAPTVDERLRVSLGNLPDWDFQRDFKKTLSTNSNKDQLPATSPLAANKVSSATALEPIRTYEPSKPNNFEGSSPSKQPYYLNDSTKPNSQVRRTNSMNPNAPNNDSVDYKRKGILEEHAFCLNGLKVAVDFIKAEDRDCMAFCHIILKKSEERLKKICESVDVTEIEYQDIIMSINNELRQIEREISGVRDELAANGYDLKVVSDGKRFLSNRFKETEPNLKLWSDMATFLFGERTVPNKEMNSIELVMNIKQRLM
jgi:uncharacterized protein (UPF0335 family)